ncbi:hypothetical protein BH11GEM1_BH11GEM1_08610 [soil metagenome]
MMSSLYYANVTVHVLAAMLWVGGMLFLGLIGAPVLRAVEPPELRQRLFQQLGLRFRSVSWWAIGTLLLTGLVNLHFKGWLRWNGALGSPAFWRTPVGHSLAIKLVAVAVMLALSAVHDFVHGPRAGTVRPGSPQALMFRRRALRFARVNALLGVLVVALAVRLARGG